MVRSREAQPRQQKVGVALQKSVQIDIPPPTSFRKRPTLISRITHQTLQIIAPAQSRSGRTLAPIKKSKFEAMSPLHDRSKRKQKKAAGKTRVGNTVCIM